MKAQKSEHEVLDAEEELMLKLLVVGSRRRRRAYAEVIGCWLVK